MKAGEQEAELSSTELGGRELAWGLVGRGAPPVTNPPLMPPKMPPAVLMLVVQIGVHELLHELLHELSRPQCCSSSP